MVGVRQELIYNGYLTVTGVTSGFTIAPCAAHSMNSQLSTMAVFCYSFSLTAMCVGCVGMYSRAGPSAESNESVSRVVGSLHPFPGLAC